MIRALRSYFGRGVCPYQFSFVLSSWLRRLILAPETLAQRLELSPGARVLEIGPGPGYFSPAVSRCIPGGQLVLFDLQPGMLKIAHQRLSAQAGSANLAAAFLQGSALNLPLAANSFDVVFLVAVLGELPDARSGLVEAARVLRPGGMLSVTEQPGDPDFVPLAECTQIALEAGFLLRRVYGSGKNFTANYRKPSPQNNERM